ncbi:type II secretion system F family protein [Caulobacter sp. 17J80-11]|uniref:type II secretion system F family protein n=1 Tax=Caulobacter sp. 17J80-11 TaxID=2763502 RepID=UPI0016534827|nr:type II secretion system F family protein [Caulobacter sp. 17J80-11]MBC6981655.1 type II secretion system F family protein [Caulobacter sp. 17J80-11]
MNIVSVLTNRDNIIAALVALLVFGTVVSLMAPMFGREKLEDRMKSVASRREELKRRSRQTMAKDGGLRHQDEGFYTNVVNRLNLKTLLEDPKVVDKLAQAGYRGPRPVTLFYFFRFATPFVLACFAAFYLYVLKVGNLPAMTKLVFVMGAFVAGYYAPNLYIANVASKRRDKIMAAFPDALDLLLICVESGMSVEAALQKVSAEVGRSSIELAEELSLLVAELSYLPERRQAYEGFAKRTNHPGIKSVATAMVQAEKYGTPLGTALRVMAKENRELRLAAAEKKAAALPAQLTVPMILFFLPVLFVVILGPAILQIMDIQK